MKKQFLLLIPSLFLVCSCGEKKTNPIIDDDDEEITEKIHATSVSGDPTSSFYLKVGKTRTIKATLSPSPTLDKEKTFSWTNSNASALSYTVSEDTRSATLEGKAAGKSTLVATNDYNEELKRNFYANVIEFDENKDYLWEYASADRAQFGYNSTDAKVGTASGTANLGGMQWAYTRSNTESLQSASGSVGFGKGQAPELNVNLVAQNTRTISKIVVETASANSLAQCTVKIGDTSVIDAKAPKLDSTNNCTALSSADKLNLSGNISISFQNEAYDPNRADDPTYKAPGAVYLKSILIYFEGQENITLTKVKDTSDIVDGARYVIVGSSDKGYGLLDGSISTSVKDNPYFVEGFALDDSITQSATFKKYGFTATLVDGKLKFAADNGIQIGLANGGGLSTTKSPSLTEWSYAMNSNGSISMSMMDAEETPKLKYFAANKSTGKFTSVSSDYQNVYLYKFAA